MLSLETDEAAQLVLAMSAVWASLPCLISARTFASVTLKLSFSNVESELFLSAAVLSTALLTLASVFLVKEVNTSEEKRPKSPISALRLSHDSLGFLHTGEANPEQSALETPA